MFTTSPNPFLLNLVPTFDVGNPGGVSTDTSATGLSNVLIPTYINPTTNTICADIIGPCTTNGFVTINGSVNIVGDLTVSNLAFAGATGSSGPTGPTGSSMLNPSELLKQSTSIGVTGTSAPGQLVGSKTITLTTSSRIAAIVTANFSISGAPSSVTVSLYVNINGVSGGTTQQTIVVGSTGLALTVLDRSSTLGPGSYPIDVYAYCSNTNVVVTNVDILALGDLL